MCPLGALALGADLHPEPPSGFTHRDAFGVHTLSLYLTLDLDLDAT